MEKTFETEINEKILSIKSGKLAKQASGAALVQLGGTIVLTTVVASKETKITQDFLPLSVEYQEKSYSTGKIPGNYLRREVGKPSEKEVLTCRLIDRSIRPLFPKNYCSETQIIATVLSMDRENDPDMLALLGASASLTISDIPFEGPIAGIRVGRINDAFVSYPTHEQYKQCDINIVLAGSKTSVIMVEGGANIISEAEILEAIDFGYKAMQPVIDLQIKLQKTLGKPKRKIITIEKDQKLISKVEKEANSLLENALTITDKIQRRNAISEAKINVLEKLTEEFAEKKDALNMAFNDILKKISREIIINKNTRIDGRKFDEVRKIACEVGFLPRPHGSALFTRGETQVLGTLTLGSTIDEQRIDGLNGEESKRFMLHYNFPPFAVGETKRIFGPNRRDIGHGALATRALEPILPNKNNFEYTIRLVSEVMESNGSSSMGTVCSGILALMDGGVPIKAPVSGIAMGLVKEGNKVVILTDILGDEDHTGDMDFKIAGTKEGITALQMDIKIKEISSDILAKALEQARLGRLYILDKMMEVIRTHRELISPYAPKVLTTIIKIDKIREIIGPGGKVIRAIQTDTNTRIEVEDNGLVKITADSEKDGKAALKMIEDIGKDPKIDEIYDGIVAKTTDFGAFVTIKPGTDGLVHISELAHKRVRKVTDVVKEGETLKVKILEVARDGKIRLSHKATLDK